MHPYYSSMNKDDAKYMFGGTRNLTRALGITKQSVSQWPYELPQKTVDWITGAAIRVGIDHTVRKPVFKNED